MTTASYISPGMRELSTAAEQAGIVILNECGVDPGLDHMSAMRVFDEAKQSGGRVLSFRSYCGGLPAPEANTNPIGYKFSWAPRGVLVAATNSAKYLEKGQIVDIPGDKLFHAPQRVEVPGAGVFEGYPNRDCLPYIEMYGLEKVETFFRGTLRNQGHCEVFYPWVKAGLMDQSPLPDIQGMTYRGFMARVAGSGLELEAIRAGLAGRMGVSEDHRAIALLDWLGLWEEEAIGLDEGGCVDILARRMAARCPFLPGERDMLVMQHEFVVQYPDKKEKRTSSLVDFGIPGGDTSMARTVSLPLAIATRMVLDGTIRRRGVIAPIDKDVYNPILDECESLGIAFQETVSTL
jgi:saccharopine dehydrogenase-like NADP-dependent oxidoreductase